MECDICIYSDIKLYLIISGISNVALLVVPIVHVSFNEQAGVIFTDTPMMINISLSAENFTDTPMRQHA